MGQTLSEPVIDKNSTEDGDERLIYAASSMQGWRVSMEDAHTTILRLEDSDVAYFAVYDGHGGHKVAKYSGTQLHKRIAAEEDFQKGQYPQAIKNGFLGTDADLRQHPDYADDISGCTAVVAIIEPGKRVFVGNAGDSRAVISVNGEVKALSHDHKPANKVESDRILAAGGWVEFGRVNGNLALSRALGDFEFKRNQKLNPEEQIVTSNPDIIEHKLGEEEEFIVLACDGIWDCMSSQEVVNYVRKGIADRLALTIICEKLMEKCLANESEIGGIGCDNMTVVIVGLLNGLTKQEWYDSINKKVQEGVVLVNPVLPVLDDPTFESDESGSKHVDENGNSQVLASVDTSNTLNADEGKKESEGLVENGLRETNQSTGNIEDESKKDDVFTSDTMSRISNTPATI